MLVLQRKSGEALLINGNIFIKISEINGDKVKIAIDAPRNVDIMRLELAEAAKINNESASASLEALAAIKIAASENTLVSYPQKNEKKENKQKKIQKNDIKEKRNESVKK